jgi:hypothetical protein
MLHEWWSITIFFSRLGWIYSKKRDRTNETKGIGSPWESDQGLGIAQPWTQLEKKRENRKLLFKKIICQKPYSTN